MDVVRTLTEPSIRRSGFALRTSGAAVAALSLVGSAAVTLVSATPAGAIPPSPNFLARFNTVDTIASTVPPNGDLNPYGIANVTQSVGHLVAGDTLVSNFNAKSNLQGTGTTIVQISPGGSQSVFSNLGGSLPGACPGGVGLTTALTVLDGGFVVVGSLPVTNGGTGTPEAGCLIVVNSEGVPVETWSGSPINGPWDMTATQSPGSAQLFVTNVLNGTVAGGGKIVDKGTVVRIDVALPGGHNPEMTGSTVVATGFAEQLNSSALVLGPTGVGLGGNGTLYVADTVENRIAAIPGALTRNAPIKGGGKTVTSGGSLNAPLGLAIAPGGHILTVNGGDPDAVETTPNGVQVEAVRFDPAGLGGDLFGLTVGPAGDRVLFVDDGDNTLKQFFHG